ncbi:MAG: DNA mismatch repair protein MutS [Bacteroidota bacterium]|nr:DNA mismatch repair protein MutS [Bacteroidota bacterium]
MTFQSISFKDINEKEVLETAVPAFFPDLNLDQITNSIVSGKDEYNLKPFFYTSLNNTGSISYRQEIFKDLENPALFKHINSFAENMRTVRQQLVQTDKLYYKYHRERLFLNIIILYCEALNSLANHLSLVNLTSQGFLSFREYLTGYVQSVPFTSLLAEVRNIIAGLSPIKYNIHIKGLHVQVRDYESESDYSAEVEETFSKFKMGAVKDYSSGFSHPLDMNFVEAKILDGVASLHPGIFLHLDTFCTENHNFQDETITVFDREIQFYIAYLDYIAPLRNAGLKFCYPGVSGSKEIYDYEGFDLALAWKLHHEKSSVVTNDFFLNGKERIMVVSGPNQGGKTTFARTFGQLHFLAGIGCPVPGREAHLFLYNRLFTHFEKEEDIQNLRSKLEDDLVRIYEILSQARPDSIIILNEILTSTTLQDGIFLSKNIMERIVQLDSLCVWVTFIDELASYCEKTVSMVGTVIPENPALRTFKIERKPADGLAYALSVAEK